MARMIGDKIWHRECRDCCGEKTTTKNMRRLEKVEWQTEVDEDLSHGMFCGHYDCPECGGEDDYNPYDNADLEGIPGVWCDVDWRSA